MRFKVGDLVRYIPGGGSKPHNFQWDDILRISSERSVSADINAYSLCNIKNELPISVKGHDGIYKEFGEARLKLVSVGKLAKHRIKNEI